MVPVGISHYQACPELKHTLWFTYGKSALEIAFINNYILKKRGI